jgi:hypothetical protein
VEFSGRFPNTERFERESAVVDGILADIERKAKPTLEALLATYPTQQTRVLSTPNQLRWGTIQRAKAFVAETIVPSSLRNGINVNADKRTVVAVVKRASTGFVKQRYFAKCDPDDVFNADIGKAIALGRALGVDVTEFTKAVQPTEVVVGHRIKYVGNVFRRRYGEVFKVNPPGTYKSGGGECAIDSHASQNSVITDDTDAVYE